MQVLGCDIIRNFFIHTVQILNFPPEPPTVRMNHMETEEKPTFSWSKFFLVWELIRAYRLRFALVVLIGMGMAFAQFIYPFIIQHVVDDVLVARGPARLIVLYFGWYIVISLVVALVTYVRANWMLHISKHVLRDLRVRAVERILRFPVRYFDSEDVGKITAKVCADVDSVDHMMTHFVWNCLIGFLQFIIGLYICSRYSWKLTLITLLIMPATLLTVELLFKRMRKLAQAERQAIGDFSSRLTSVLNGIRVVKAFNQEARENVSLAADADNIALNGIRNWSFVNLFRGFEDFITQFGITAVLGVAAWIVLQNQMTVGQFMGYNALVYMLINPFFMILSAWSLVPNGVAAFDRVTGLLREEIEMAGRTGLRAPAIIRGEVRFEGVCFSYGNAVDVMSDVSFHAPAGQTIAIVGHSGAGKTTLMNLLMGFYFPEKGRVSIDGLDTREWDLKALRQATGIVLQDTVLFNDTISYNVSYGRPDATEDQIREALRIADALEFVEAAPGGLSAQVGVNGIKLSGGQKQRLAIARAVLRDPRILLFDEATSHLDSLAERAIQKAMKEVSKGRTTFIIAHRLSTVAHADLILVFHGGRIVEAGRHHELLQRKGVYQSLHDAQVFKFTDGEILSVDE